MYLVWKSINGRYMVCYTFKMFYEARRAAEKHNGYITKDNKKLFVSEKLLGKR